MKQFRIIIISLLVVITLYAESIDFELYKKADEYFAEKKYYNAGTIYENLITSDDIKDKSELFYKLGICYSKLQQKEKAFKILKRLIDEYPESQFTFKSIPIVLNYYKNKRKFNEGINLGLKYYKHNIEIKKQLLELYEYKKDYATALSFLELNFYYKL